jgi:hypothetical protein
MVVSCQMSNISARLWWEQVTFYEMKMLLALYEIEMLSWIFIVPSHRNNHPRIYIATINTVSWFRTIMSLLCTSECCIPSRLLIPLETMFYLAKNISFLWIYFYFQRKRHLKTSVIIEICLWWEHGFAQLGNSLDNNYCHLLCVLPTFDDSVARSGSLSFTVSVLPSHICFLVLNLSSP